MRSLAVVVSAVLATLTGCGPSNMRLWGEVTYDGRPVELGTIEFIPMEGTSGPSTGGRIEAGRYDVPAKVGPLPKGTYKVAISWVVPTGKKVPDPLNHKLLVPELGNCIPVTYNSQTTLRMTVSDRAADNHHDYRLEKQGGRR